MKSTSLTRLVDDGDHLVIPSARHDLTALTDTAVLLTVATRA